ncbi:MAG: hypothetical protein CMJ75_18230 [Planctomycetaceae bacterium]|nr:hypothetical protein [Planctomycetaceae bacterium]
MQHPRFLTTSRSLLVFCASLAFLAGPLRIAPLPDYADPAAQPVATSAACCCAPRSHRACTSTSCVCGKSQDLAHDNWLTWQTSHCAHRDLGLVLTDVTASMPTRSTTTLRLAPYHWLWSDALLSPLEPHFRPPAQPG